jgi:phosphatidate cytidylyltransferase
MEDDGSEDAITTVTHRSASSDARRRLVPGVVLAAVTGILTWAGLIPFAALMLVIGLLMCWEWARVVRNGELDITLLVHATSTALAVGLAAAGLAALGLAAVVGGAMIALAIEIGRKPLVSAAGVLYTGVPAVSLLWFRSDEPWGAWAVLFLFTVVAATDTLAYAFGRVIGGPKLWPRVSPNKTWSGFLGGISAAAVVGSLFHLPSGSSPLALALVGLLLGVVAQAGDLAESALKRSFGVKDASGLIPGHGGFMDRADGIVAAAVAAAVYAMLAGPGAPAAALLMRSS